MALPQAVLDQDKEADEAIAAMQAERADDTNDVSEDEFFGVDDDFQTSDAVHKEEPPPVTVEDQRLKTLQGKYNAEVPRLHREAQALRDEVNELRELLLQRQEEEALEPINFNEASRKYLKPEEIEDFSEALDTHTRMAQGTAEAVVSRETQRLMATIHQLESRLASIEGNAGDAELDKLWVKIEKHIPGAQEINDDPMFAGFLEEVDELSGLSYRALGEAAMGSGDVGRMVEIFQEYQTRYGTAPEKKEKGSPPVKPGTTSARQAAPAGSQKIIRESVVKKFYQDWARGKYTDEQGKKLEAEIERAHAEGRIKSG